MKKEMVALAAVAVFLTGCIVTSVHPYYTAKDVSYDPGLIGQWTNGQEAGQHWSFEKQADKSYQLTYFSGSDKDKTNVARALLFNLNGSRFLDCVAHDQECDVMPPPIPSHFLLRVYQVEPTLRLAALNHDWLRTALDKEPKLIRHEMIGEKDDRRVVLTAETAELQDFLLKHLDAEEAWQEPFDLKRQATP